MTSSVRCLPFLVKQCILFLPDYLQQNSNVQKQILALTVSRPNLTLLTGGPQFPVLPNH
uniref:Uncharacterized protein n=1 Tax=Anguilla anguilla TaxID=7936 RepID=A0A0E9WS81_ANGAN